MTGTLPGKYWMKGSVVPSARATGRPAGVAPDGSWYRLKAEANGQEYYCKPEHIRSAAGPGPAAEGVPADGRATDGTGAGDEKFAAAGAFLDCPVAQRAVRYGARPDAELFRKLIRCKKGEKAVPEGGEGAVEVEVASIRIGQPRPWSYRQDSGSGQAVTTVYPVHATYTVKTLYRRATEVEEGWQRILNFYVNSFGEWEIGSEQNVKSPTTRRIPKE